MAISHRKLISGSRPPSSGIAFHESGALNTRPSSRTTDELLADYEDLEREDIVTVRAPLFAADLCA